MYNFLGNVFQIGDFVAYPVRTGSSLWMSFGIIYELKTIHNEWLKCDKLRVGVIIVRIGSERSKYEYRNDDFLKPYADGTSKQLFFHKVTVSPNRIVRLNENDIPLNVVNKLKDVWKENTK